jgi:hypothetical protein
MEDRLTFEIEFRLNRLSVRLGRLASHFEQLSAGLQQDDHSGQCLKCLQECKFFLEWTGIDLDVDRAYELVQMQRQLIQWQRNWEQIWQAPTERLQRSQDLQIWGARMREMTKVLA